MINSHLADQRLLSHYLEQCFKLAAEGTEFGLEQHAEIDEIHRTTFVKIMQRTGGNPRRKPFQNQRSSQEPE